MSKDLDPPPPYSRQVVQNSGSRPLGQNVGSRPLGQNVSSGPLGQNVGSRPLGQNVGSWPLGQSVGSRPLGQNVGSRPLGQNVSSRPLGQDSGCRCISHANENTPLVFNFPRRSKSQRPVLLYILLFLTTASLLGTVGYIISTSCGTAAECAAQRARWEQLERDRLGRLRREQLEREERERQERQRQRLAAGMVWKTPTGQQCTTYGIRESCSSGSIEEMASQQHSNFCFVFRPIHRETCEYP